MMKKLLPLVVLVMVNNSNAAEQPQGPVNQENAQVTFGNSDWGWYPDVALWLNHKTGEVTEQNPHTTSKEALKVVNCYPSQQ